MCVCVDFRNSKQSPHLEMFPGVGQSPYQNRSCVFHEHVCVGEGGVCGCVCMCKHASGSGCVVDAAASDVGSSPEETVVYHLGQKMWITVQSVEC